METYDVTVIGAGNGGLTAAATLAKEGLNVLLLESPTGKKVGFVQIAGLVARRIICAVQSGDVVKRGQRFGMICFGSRLEVYLPKTAAIQVKVGDKVQAGSSILGKW